MSNTRVIFMGTPEFAVPILEMLIKETKVIMVVTQSDKEVGRHHEVIYSPIKQVAIDHNIPVFQPLKIRNDYEPIINLNPDIIITCAYGQIIPEVILNCPKLGCINVHASLLPKLRGGAPINHAIIDGDKKTGITIMYMAPGMDDGDIISQESYLIKNNDTYGTLHDTLQIMGRDLLLKTLPLIINKTNMRLKQNEKDVTFGYVIKRAEEHLDFNDQGQKIDNKVRGLNPNPLVNILINNIEYKIGKGHFIKTKSLKGKVNVLTKNELGIGCVDGIYFIDKIKPAGKKMMKIKDFINGIDKDSFLNSEIK